MHRDVYDLGQFGGPVRLYFLEVLLVKPDYLIHSSRNDGVEEAPIQSKALPDTLMVRGQLGPKPV